MDQDKDEGIKTGVCAVCEGSGQTSISEDKLEIAKLQGEVRILKALLSSKQEQIDTLRNVLESKDENAAAVALSDLQIKYEKDLTIVNEAMLTLLNKVRTLKEDAVASFDEREMLEMRLIGELNRKLAVAEEKCLAVQQKLILTMKLDELVFDRDLHATRGDIPAKEAEAVPSADEASPAVRREFL